MKVFSTPCVISDLVARFGQSQDRTPFFPQNGKLICLILLLLLVSGGSSFAQSFTENGLLASTIRVVPSPKAAYLTDAEVESPRVVPAAPHVVVSMMTIKGRIIDVDRDPLVGATIFVKGTRVIAITDADGCYSLKVPAGAYTLCCGSAGYYDHEVAARPTATDLTVMLEYRPDAFKRIKQK